MYLGKSYIIEITEIQMKYTNYLQVMLMRLMLKSEYLIIPKGTKFTGLGKSGLNDNANLASTIYKAL